MLKTPLFARAVSELLRIDGFFPTRPEQVNFTLAFEIGDGKWQLSALGVHATPPQHATAALETSDAKLPATTGSIAVTTQPKR